MKYSQGPEIDAASSLVVAALQEFYEQGRRTGFPIQKKENQMMLIIEEIKNK